MVKPGKEFVVKVCSLRLQCWKKIEDQWPNKEWSIIRYVLTRCSRMELCIG